jgi:hypothetical protein
MNRHVGECQSLPRFISWNDATHGLALWCACATPTHAASPLISAIVKSSLLHAHGGGKENGIDRKQERAESPLRCYILATPVSTSRCNGTDTTTAAGGHELMSGRGLPAPLRLPAPLSAVMRNLTRAPELVTVVVTAPRHRCQHQRWDRTRQVSLSQSEV